MDFGSIIGFLAIAFISSLFNKDKNAKKPQVQRSKTTTAGNPATKPPNVTKPRMPAFTGRLEDLFNDFRGEIDKTLRDNDKTQSYLAPNQDIANSDNIELKQKENKSMSSRLIDNSMVRDSISDGEIGKEEILIEFDKKSIVQGIIMSEILQKPKSLRR